MTEEEGTSGGVRQRGVAVVAVRTALGSSSGGRTMAVVREMTDGVTTTWDGGGARVRRVVLSELEQRWRLSGSSGLGEMRLSGVRRGGEGERRVMGGCGLRAAVGDEEWGERGMWATRRGCGAVGGVVEVEVKAAKQGGRGGEEEYRDLVEVSAAARVEWVRRTRQRWSLAGLSAAGGRTSGGLVMEGRRGGGELGGEKWLVGARAGRARGGAWSTERWCGRADLGSGRGVAEEGTWGGAEVDVHELEAVGTSTRASELVRLEAELVWVGSWSGG